MHNFDTFFHLAILSPMYYLGSIGYPCTFWPSNSGVCWPIPAVHDNVEHDDQIYDIYSWMQGWLSWILRFTFTGNILTNFLHTLLETPQYWSPTILRSTTLPLLTFKSSSNVSSLRCSTGLLVVSHPFRCSGQLWQVSPWRCLFRNLRHRTAICSNVA